MLSKIQYSAPTRLDMYPRSANMNRGIIWWEDDQHVLRQIKPPARGHHRTSVMEPTMSLIPEDTGWTLQRKAAVKIIIRNPDATM